MRFTQIRLDSLRRKRIKAGAARCAPTENHNLLRLLVCLCLGLCLAGCELRFGATPTPLPTATEPPVLTVVWTQGDGNLMAWRDADPAARQIASGGVIHPYLAPDGEHVAFTRGAQGDAISLWAVGSDGTGERELVAPDVIPSIRNGHPQIGRAAWLDNQTIYFETYQRYASGIARDDNLYRVTLDGEPQLILPPGAGGVFALSPDGQHVAVARAGSYDMQKGSIAVLDPLGVEIDDKLSFTAVSAPSEVPVYPPMTWSDDSAFARVPIPDRESDRVALWRIPVEGEAQIFGYISAAREGLPLWSGDQMIYWRYGENGTPELLVADANGENAEVYASGNLSNLRWLDDGATFVFDRDDTVWLGERGKLLRRLDVPTNQVVFAGADRFVYLESDGLLAGDLSGNAMWITGAETITRIDAVVAPVGEFAP